MSVSRRIPLSLALLLLSLFFVAASEAAFVNWESPHVHPLDMTPDGARLLAVNTADSRLEVFDLSSGTPVWSHSIPTGLDPVAVRARTDDEAWVVNHISDTVSIVRISTGVILATLDTDDEPADVVFAGNPVRAFVSCSAANTVLVFDPTNLGAAPSHITLDGEDPRALAVSPDGSLVYAAIFESGNGTTLLTGDALGNASFQVPDVVSHPSGPYGGENPAPNSGNAFEPPQNPANPSPADQALIVRRTANGSWLDDNGGDWTSMVTGSDADLSGRPQGWDLLDHDVAVINAANLNVSYVDRLMNHNMALAVNPDSGQLAVVGTDSMNQIRYEPNLNGRFLRVQGALVPVAGQPSVVDLNSHLSYSTSSVSNALRDRSLGDPRGAAWEAGGETLWVTGMGSDNLVSYNSAGARTSGGQPIHVGQGPTGLAIDDVRDRIYVLNRFEPSISVVNPATRSELQRVSFFDSTPDFVQRGRAMLYDTRETSGTGHVSCGSCHLDGRMDRLAWDLGDPSGDMLSADDQNIGMGLPFDDGTDEFHPMKGPMLTQTLQDIIGKEPFHWRGDRDSLLDFSPAFTGLLGDDAEPSPLQMQDFSDFLATLVFPPNPFRNLDNSLSTNVPLPGLFRTGRFGGAGQPMPNGDAVEGLDLYRPPTLLLQDNFACSSCHTLPTGMGPDSELDGGNFDPLPPGPNGERHHGLVAVFGFVVKVPQLRNMYDRVGMDTSGQRSLAGFGYTHDGKDDTLARFLSSSGFTFNSEQEIADVAAFLMSFAGSDLPLGDNNDDLEPLGPLSKDTHAGVGAQVTVSSSGSPDSKLSQMIDLADDAAVGLIAHALRGGEPRGYAYRPGGPFQSDRAAETLTTEQLLGGAAPGSAVTFTLVPAGNEDQFGIDRDLDGAFDRDEVDAGSNPADPDDLPPCCAEGPLLFEATFNSDNNGFDYQDDTFRGTSAPAYASGFRNAGAGDGGSLVVDLGGIDGADIPGMSGAWGRSLPVPLNTPLLLSFRYQLTQTPEYESNEFSQVMVSFGGNVIGVAPNDYIDQIAGNGGGGSSITTGWQTVLLDLGPATNRNDRLVVGAYNNLKTFANESTELLIDNLRIMGADPCAADTDDDGISDCDDTCLDMDDDGYGEGPDCLDDDCDDDDPSIHPLADESCNGVDDDCDAEIDEDDAVDTTTWFADDDTDGYGNAAVTQDACAAPAGFVDNDQDCDDTDGTVHPGAVDVCNGEDDDCDTLIDEDGVSATWYADADTDGFGNPGVSVETCSAPAGFVSNSLDCDDTNPAIHPGVSDVCNGADDDCDGATDEDGATSWFADADSDGYGNPTVALDACSAPIGYVADNQDCDDANPAIHPGVPDDCNGTDDDCDGAIDEDGATTTWYADQDGDGYGDSAAGTEACFLPAGFVADATDCDDADASVNPAGAEVCNGVDDDCDTEVDEDAVDTSTFFADNDGDGFGDAGVAQDACFVPTGFVADAQDCDDTDPAVHPGVPDVCNGADDDCDGTVDEDSDISWFADADGDGYGDPGVTASACSAPAGYVADDQDCDDSNSAVHPGATDDCNGTDDDCDGAVDEDGATATWFADDDGDGFGDPGDSSEACFAPPGFVADNGDCNDADAAVHPGATDVCNGEDDDCDSVIDEDAATSTWFNDGDSDGFGDPGTTAEACAAPTGFVGNNLDCNDADAAIHPGAFDACDGVNDDCDGEVDEDHVSVPVECGVGSCAAFGATLCTAGTVVAACTPGDPLPEVCDDGEDNDCNGSTDCEDGNCTDVEVCNTGFEFVADFESGDQGLDYVDDPFRNTSAPTYASGAWAPGAGFGGGGALRVELGGINNSDIVGMSGGWRLIFDLDAPSEVFVTFRYMLTQAPDYESDESSELLVSIDGQLRGPGGSNVVAQIAGNGNDGPSITTGWQQTSFSLGVLGTGSHTAVFGGYNSKKTYDDEITEALVDDLSISSEPGDLPTSTTLIDESFGSGGGSFAYLDDLFRGTSQPSYASGAFASGAGQSGDGALRVNLGGINGSDIIGMSAGWRTTFVTTETSPITLILDYRLTQTSSYEGDEFSQVLAALNGVLVGPGSLDYIDQTNGNSGSSDTGWATIELDLGVLPPGTYQLDLGGYNNKKTSSSESTEILLDRVRVATVE